MADFKIKAKKIIRELPYSIGRWLSFIPFRIVFGSAFNDFKEEIRIYDNYSVEQQKDYILSKFQNIVSYSYSNIPFYNDFYRKHNFHPDQLLKFEDLQRIPILTKNDLNNYKIDDRSVPDNSSEKINTGGTSGQPLEFYIEKNALAREWSHMLTIWSKLGYQRTDLKLNFRGRNIGKDEYQYNPVGNEYIINTFANFEKVCYSLRPLLQKKLVRYLHGYPSAIYEFAKYVKDNDHYLLHYLNKNLNGILLGSEYPAPVYRDLIDEVFDCPSISWYGHSEMCILAYEKREKGLYEPMGSYGYCEAVPDTTGSYKLVGTSFYNNASPFIRYNTGDLITPKKTEAGLLKSFKIEEGRIGEFVLDKKNHRISLTSLIFGRHHKIFGKAKFVQVHQPCKGEVIIIITVTKSDSISLSEAQENFDSRNIDLDFKFKIVDEAYRTPSGKVPLLIKETDQFNI